MSGLLFSDFYQTNANNVFYEFNSNKIFRSSVCSCGYAYIGCVACDLKKEKIYCSGINMYNTDLNTQFLGSNPQTVHAEENTVRKLKTSEKHKPIDIVVFRTNKNGTSLLMAKSCHNCKSLMNKILIQKNWKPRKLIFTDENGQLRNDHW